MADNKPEKNKEGMTVHEIENFGKKYKFEISFLVIIVLASFFTFAFWGAAWSIYLCGLGGVLGVWLPDKIASVSETIFSFITKQEKITQIVLAVVGVIVAIFLAPIVFFALGILGGMAMCSQAYRHHS